MMRKSIGSGRSGSFSADSTDKRFRSPNITPSEKDLLFALISKRINILESKKTDVASINMKNAEWQKICDEFNATSGIFFRTPMNLRAAWDNWKKYARKNLRLDKSVRKDPFTERVLSVLLNAKENEPRISAEKAVQDAAFNNAPQDEIIEIVKTDIFISEDTFQSTNESCPSDHLSVDTFNTDAADQLASESASQNLEVKKEAFSNFLSHPSCVTSSQTSVSSPLDRIIHTVPRDDPLKCTPLVTYQGTSISPETSVSKSLWCIPNPSSEVSTQSVQCNLEKPTKHASCQTSDSVTPERTPSNEPIDLSRAKIEAMKVVTKNYAEEHRILQEYFAIKMLQEKEVLEIEKRKHEIEAERLSQEKIKSQMLLLQLEQLKRTVT